MTLQLDTPIQFVKGVGPKRAGEFNKAGITTVEELLRYPPFRYEDRTRFSRIRDIQPGEDVLISGVVYSTGRYSTRRKRTKIVEITVADSSGHIPVKYFNQPYLVDVLKKGTQVILYGIPRTDFYSGLLSLVNPELEVLSSEDDLSIHTGRIVPVYRRIGPMTTCQLRSIICRLLGQMDSELRDPLPETIRKKWRFPSLSQAFFNLHFPVPETNHTVEQLFRDLKAIATPSQRRFIFEEFFSFQIGMGLLRNIRVLLSKNRRIRVGVKIRERIKSILPFHPTRAQKKVVKEIIDDLQSPAVMHRLLQGDVGSGKTIAALQAIVVMIENGFQTALMAPTEILAEQHFKNITRYLRSTPYRVRIGRGRFAGLCILMVGSVRTQEAYQRLEIMRKSSDGFEIAEKDLDIRGPGEFLGTRQSGLPAFRFGNIVRDRKLLELARIESENYLEEILMEMEENGRERSLVLDHLLKRWKQKYRLFEVG